MRRKPRDVHREPAAGALDGSATTRHPRRPRQAPDEHRAACGAFSYVNQANSHRLLAFLTSQVDNFAMAQ